MTRKKLIFFADHADTISTGPVRTAYHFALIAHRAGLEAEIRLAAGALDIFHRDGADLPKQGDSLTVLMHEAVDRGVYISACVNSTAKREGIDQKMLRWGTVSRGLDEVLTEVADGRSELIYMG